MPAQHTIAGCGYGFNGSIGEARQRVEQERQAVAKLEQNAMAWQRAQTIRAYVDAVEAKTREKGTLNDEQLERIACARQLADRIDPLCDATPSALETDENAIRPLGQ